MTSNRLPKAAAISVALLVGLCGPCVLLGFEATTVAAATTWTQRSSANLPTASDESIAEKINLVSSDLPNTGTWASSSQTTGGNDTAKLALACVRDAGGIYADASPAVEGLSGGAVTANVSSRLFSLEGGSLEAGIESQVEFVSSVRQAAIDYSIDDTRREASCTEQLLTAALNINTGVKTHITDHVSALGEIAPGIRGLNDQVIIHAGVGNPDTYVDVLQYFDGRAEVEVTFVSAPRQIPSSWRKTVTTGILARMQASLE
jgi:hypothetical protein